MWTHDSTDIILPQQVSESWAKMVGFGTLAHEINNFYLLIELWNVYLVSM